MKTGVKGSINGSAQSSLSMIQPERITQVLGIDKSELFVNQNKKKKQEVDITISFPKCTHSCEYYLWAFLKKRKIEKGRQEKRKGGGKESRERERERGRETQFDNITMIVATEFQTRINILLRLSITTFPLLQDKEKQTTQEYCELSRIVNREKHSGKIFFFFVFEISIPLFFPIYPYNNCYH